jgi:phosphate transport system permease protein
LSNQRFKAILIKYFLQSCGSVSIIIVLLIFLFLFKEAFPFIFNPGIGELFHNVWNPVSFQKEEFGIVPLITGSLVVTVLATIIAIPFGIIGAIYISEIATYKEREFLKPFIEILAGIPSVVLGFFGLVVIAPLIKNIFGLNSGLTALTGAILLAFMAIPTIMSISEDAIKSVPSIYKEASLALGASKLETILKVTVPAALSGIIASVMLGMGRVIGETMTVMMVTGNAPLITLNPFSSVRTMTATIAAEMGEVTIGSHHYMALFWVGIVLMLLTFILNLISYRVLKKYGMIEK